MSQFKALLGLELKSRYSDYDALRLLSTFFLS